MNKNKKWEIKKSGINGRGMFATRMIKKGELIDYIRGPLVKIKKEDLEKMSSSNPNWIGVGRNQWIDPELPFVAINHSCDPNSGIKGKVSYFAMRDIKIGEEITFDYSTSEVDLLWELDYICNCNYAKCRKTIRSIQYLPRKTINKYMPYIPTLFKKIYDDYKK